jgi:large subunit ribosomal protein L4
MTIEVLKTDGSKAGKKVNLNSDIFGVEPNEHAVYLDVKQFLANQRQGTAKSKQRNEISGSTRKIKRQKGTGTARAGSIKSPVFVGGGRIFGPIPRDYSFKLNKKLKRLARISALSSKAQAEELIVVENPQIGTPKTADFVKLLNNLKLNDKKTLVVVPEPDKNIYLSSRNLEGVSYVTASNLNTYGIINAQKILFVEGAIEKVEALLSK